MRTITPLVLTCLLLCASAQAAVIHVPGDAATIQQAVNIANPNDTIQVAAGTWNEHVLITRNLSGVTLAGNADAFGQGATDPGITTIAGGVEFNYALTINGFTFQNLYLRRSTAGPIIRAGSTNGPVNNLTLQDCVLDGQFISTVSGFYFVRGQTGGDVTVHHVEFRDILNFAVFETSSSSSYPPTVGTYTFTNNWIHDCNGTIVLRGNPSNWTDHVNVYDNTWTNIGGNASQQGDQWAAIEINNADNVSFKRNYISDVSMGAGLEGEAIQLWNIGTMDMSDNQFLDNYQGVFVWSGGTINNVVLRSNNISGNDQYGIENNTTTNIDARYNWWGAADGPGPVGPGSGDRVSTYVICAPWLTSPASSVTVTVELEDVVTTPFTRDIEFLYSASSGAPNSVIRSMTFTNRTATTTLFVPPSCLSAKDDQHTLYSSVNVRDLGAGQYAASFTGSHKLLGGDLNGDDVDDIWDFGILMAQMGTSGHPYPAGQLDADITDSGTVDKNDFLVLYRHFLMRGDPPCGKTIGQLPVPRSSITVNQLSAIVGGLTKARKADLNHNGIVDTTDAKLYYLSLLIR